MPSKTQLSAKDLAEYRASLPLGRKHPDRARQFMPFAALKGYYELVRERERTTQPKRELMPEEIEAISKVLAQVSKGDIVTVTYYDRDAYVSRTGIVAQIDPVFKTLTLIKSVINFEDIADLSLLNNTPTD